MNAWSEKYVRFRRIYLFSISPNANKSKFNLSSKDASMYLEMMIDKIEVCIYEGPTKT